MKPRRRYRRHAPLLIALLSLIALPLLMRAFGLAINTASLVVILAIAALGLNLLVGYTGLTSFGHAAWFGIGAYAAGLLQKHWLHEQIILPILLSLVFIAGSSAIVGALILRRRGVYFSLLTLALSALTYTIAFRWSDVTGGEDGLGGLTRTKFGPVDLDNGIAYYVFTASIAFLVLYAMLKVVRSPFGHVLMGIRENQLRATFQGYPIQHYKLAAFVISAVVTGLAGALLGFQIYLVSAESTSVPFSGELLAMVVIGGMHHILGPPLGALFYILFRELLSIWTGNWLLWFGLVFIGFVLFSPSGLVGIWAKVRRWLYPPPREDAAMGRRKIYEGLPLPACLSAETPRGTLLEIDNVSKHFDGIRAVSNASLKVETGVIHALIGPNGAGKTTLFNIVSGLFRPNAGAVRLGGKETHRLPTYRICAQGIARSFQITNLFRNLSVYENVRLSIQARHASRFNLWRDVDSCTDVHAETAELVRFLGLEGIENIPAEDLSYGGQRLLDLGIAIASRPRVLLVDEPLAGLAAAERERVSKLIVQVAAAVPMLIIEHDIDRVLGFSDRVTVMNQGEVLLAGTPEEVRANRRVQEVYTGTGKLPVAGRTDVAGRGGQLLRIAALNAFYGKSHIICDVNLDVREGEIIALVGRNGAGKTTLLKTITGLVRPTTGTIEYEGRDLGKLAAPEIARLGVGYVPQGRGLFAGMTVADNLALGRLARATDGGRGVAWSEEEILTYFPRLKERLKVSADYLSGGEQQMVAVARALSGNVSLLLLDEPFEGLAPAVVLELFEVFDRLRRHLSIVIVEHNLDLVLALADRVFALERGSVVHEGPAAALLNDLEYRKKILWL